MGEGVSPAYGGAGRRSVRGLGPRRAARLILAAAPTAAAASLAGSCAVDSTTGPRSANADERLALFDRAHPQCQLWTNWQKMCSRTGPDGGTVCTIDPDRPVRPSEPFCVATDGLALPEPTARQRASHRRFCGNGASPGAGAPLGLCEGGEDRPFNGRRVAARQHPWCNMWADAQDNLVCQTGALNAAGVPRCDSLARQRHEADSTLSCVSRSVPDWCRFPGMLGEVWQYPFEGDWAQPGHDIPNHTVIGTYCEERR